MDEQPDAALAPTRRRARWPWIVGLVGLAIVVVTGIVALSSDPGTPAAGDRGPAVAGEAETKALLEGIQQEGLTIGDPKAPVTLLEYVDLQCPFCKVHQLDHTPELIDQLVRTGEAKISLVPLAFLGPDSTKARNVLLRLARKGRA